MVVQQSPKLPYGSSILSVRAILSRVIRHTLRCSSEVAAEGYLAGSGPREGYSAAWIIHFSGNISVAGYKQKNSKLIRLVDTYTDFNRVLTGV